MTWLALILSTALYVFSFAPFNHGSLSFIALIPLFLAWNRETRPKKILWSAFLINFGIGLGGFSWIAYATVQFGQLPWFVGILVLALFCASGQLVWLAYAALRMRLQSKHPFAWVLFSGFIFSGLEFIIPKLFLDSFGNSWHDLPTFRQLASIGGVPLITAFLIFWNEALVFGFENRKLKKQKALTALTLALLAVVSTWFYGYKRLQDLSVKSTEPPFRVSLIQANIGDVMKMAAEGGLGNASAEVIDRYLRLSQEANTTEQPDLIVWPETAYPTVFGQPSRRSERALEESIFKWRTQYPGAFAFGGYDRTPNGKEFNAIYLWDKDTPQVTEVYHKSVLLMFAETLPFAEAIPSLKGLIPNMGFFGRGNGAEIQTVHAKDGRPFLLSSQICYEGLLPEFSTDAARLGAYALLNVTNDSWFGNTGEPELHLALTIFRSIESGLPMIRATNTGISTLIDATGEITHATRVGTDAVATVSLPRFAPPEPTLYVRFPEALRILCLSILLGAFFLVLLPEVTRANRAVKK